MSKSAFTAQQERWIIFRFGDSEIKPSAAQVRRQFRTHFKVSPFDVPNVSAFRRLKIRFEKTNSTKPSHNGGRPLSIRTNETINNVSNIMSASGDTSLRKVATEISLPYSTTHMIVRKDLNLFPYKPHLTQPYCPEKRVLPLVEVTRSRFCNKGYLVR